MVTRLPSNSTPGAFTTIQACLIRFMRHSCAPRPKARFTTSTYGVATAEKLMSTTHIGKIGRLPKSIRDDLGRRLEDGEPGKESVKWLNGLPRVQEILKEQFGGRAITEQNLSEWKQGGHQEWVRHQQACEKLHWLTERADDLENEVGGLEISDRLASILAAELACLAVQRLKDVTDPQERWRMMREFLHELRHLRHEDHICLRNQLRRQRWEREVERQNEEDLKREEKEQKTRLRKICFSVLQNRTMADLFGGGEQGRKMAEMLHRIEFDLPLDDLVGPESAGKTQSDEIQPNQTQSDPIQPNPANFSNGHPPPATSYDHAT